MCCSLQQCCVVLYGKVSNEMQLLIKALYAQYEVLRFCFNVVNPFYNLN